MMQARMGHLLEPGAARGTSCSRSSCQWMKVHNSRVSVSLLAKVEGDTGNGAGGLVIPALCKRRLDLAVVSVMHEALVYHVLHLHTARREKV